MPGLTCYSVLYASLTLDLGYGRLSYGRLLAMNLLSIGSLDSVLGLSRTTIARRCLGYSGIGHSSVEVGYYVGR